MATKPDYVTDLDAQSGPDDSGVPPSVLDRIKQALVTSRITLAGQSTGADPYDSRRDRRRASVWGNRIR
jgi:hypothetical protein